MYNEFVGQVLAVTTFALTLLVNLISEQIKTNTTISQRGGKPKVEGKNTFFDKLETVSSRQEVILSSGSPDLVVKCQIFDKLEAERERLELSKTPDELLKAELFTKLEEMKEEDVKRQELKRMASKPKVTKEFVVKDRFFDRLERLKTPEAHYSKSRLFKELQRLTTDDSTDYTPRQQTTTQDAQHAPFHQDLATILLKEVCLAVLTLKTPCIFTSFGSFILYHSAI